MKLSLLLFKQTLNARRTFGRIISWQPAKVERNSANSNKRGGEREGEERWHFHLTAFAAYFNFYHSPRSPFPISALSLRAPRSRIISFVFTHFIGASVNSLFAYHLFMGVDDTLRQ